MFTTLPNKRIPKRPPKPPSKGARLSGARQVACRKQVAALLEAVLMEDITARDAINTWPCYCNTDPSVQCAYTMLWFWESDEERRWEEMMYSDMQLKLLSEVVKVLKLGHPLPPQIINQYDPYNAPPEFSSRLQFLRGLDGAIGRFIALVTAARTHIHNSFALLKH